MDTAEELKKKMKELLEKLSTSGSYEGAKTSQLILETSRELVLLKRQNDELRPKVFASTSHAHTPGFGETTSLQGDIPDKVHVMDGNDWVFKL